MEIRECKSITITMSMEETYKLEKELERMDFDDEEYPLAQNLYMLLPEKED